MNEISVVTSEATARRGGSGLLFYGLTFVSLIPVNAQRVIYK